MTTTKRDNFFETPKATLMASLILVIVILFILIMNASKEPTAYRWETYTVEQGDSLWSISRDSAAKINGEDLGSLSHIIAEKNGIKDTVIYAGQQILIPVSGKEN